MKISSESTGFQLLKCIKFLTKFRGQSLDERVLTNRKKIHNIFSNSLPSFLNLILSFAKSKFTVGLTVRFFSPHFSLCTASLCKLNCYYGVKRQIVGHIITVIESITRFKDEIDV